MQGCSIGDTGARVPMSVPCARVGAKGSKKEKKRISMILLYGAVNKWKVIPWVLGSGRLGRVGVDTKHIFPLLE